MPHKSVIDTIRYNTYKTNRMNSQLTSVMQQLQVITEKLGNMDSRMSSMEEKMKKKIKVKTSDARDVSNIHIFPFKESDEFVKMAVINDEKGKKETYPVIEMMQMDFKKLANLMVYSEMLSVQCTDFTTSNSTAKFANGTYVLCN